MTQHTPGVPGPDSRSEPDVTRDLLIGRVVDDEATPEDWAALRSRAATDPALWRDLAEAQFAHAELAAAVSAAIDPCEQVEAPSDMHLEVRLAGRLRRVAQWGGWAAAAMVALAWAGGLPADGPGGAPGSHDAGVNGPLASAADAFQRYLDIGKRSGEVVDELPERVFVTTSPTADGTAYEVFYLRQIMERAVVRELYTFEGQDELGRPIRIRMDLSGGPAGPAM